MDFFTNQNILLYLAAYLISGIPFGYLLAKQFAGVDIKNEGSGNIGATNVIRVVKEKDPKLWENADEIEEYLKNISHPKEATVLKEDIYKNFFSYQKIGGKFNKNYLALASYILTALFISLSRGILSFSALAKDASEVSAFVTIGA